MDTIKKYILVDDDSINNMICGMVINRTLDFTETIAFTEPEKALEFIKNEYNETSQPTILFLDINMPTLTGWGFLEEYEKFSDAVKEHIGIYIVSSSVDQRDKDKAHANRYVAGFLSKPLSQETLLAVAGSGFQAVKP